ncbi:VOC family protein [Microlunatus flavus]|uniref:VOC family protein n=1 Tax=Microlunatus flavus TaxID=1036181 RepID=UPI001113AF0D|nr:VOC family protein [Microlunatus flavus]
MAATFAHVVLDPPPSATGRTFWAAALGGTWRAAGPGPDHDASLVPEDGDAYVHHGREAARVPALVLEVDDLTAAIRQALDLGATEDDGLLRSPGGLALRLKPAEPDRRRAPARRWPDGTSSRLVQVCLDCPAAGAEREARFWAAVTGWAWRDCDSPEFVCHLVPDEGPLQLLVQRRASAEPDRVTVHLDLGASDREAEAARLVALGAVRGATGDGWVVLHDPDGRTFCATGQPPEAP